MIYIIQFIDIIPVQENIFNQFSRTVQFQTKTNFNCLF